MSKTMYKKFKDEMSILTKVGKFQIVNNNYVNNSNSRFAEWVKQLKGYANANKYSIVKPLYECYNRPSHLKEIIYDDCFFGCTQLSNKLAHTTLDCFGVYSYNSMHFIFLAWDSKHIYYVTKTKNIMIER